MTAARGPHAAAVHGAPRAALHVHAQGQRLYGALVQRHAAAWQCPACADDAAIMVYAGTLHNIGWLPTYCSASLGPALALELQLADRFVRSHLPTLLTGALPTVQPPTGQAWKALV